MKNKTTSKISLVLSINAIALLLFVTNPTKQAHKEKIIRPLQQNEKGRNISKELTQQISYHNFYLFSYTKFYDDYTSFGILNEVFIINDLIIETQLDTGSWSIIELPPNSE